MTGRITLSALQEMLADAAAMGAGRSDLMDKLEMRADSAKAFEAKAASCLAAATQAGEETDAAADPSPSTVDADVATAAAADTSGAVSAPLPVQPAKLTLAELESLVQEGQAIGIKLDSLTDLSRLLHTAQAWSQQAEHCLTGKEPHVGKHKRHHPRPSLEKVNSLMSELQCIAVLLPQAEALSKRQQEAHDWVDQAVRVLQQGNLGQHLSDVQAVVRQGAALGLEMPELTQLDALVRAIEWNSRVKQALRLPSHAVPGQQQSPASNHQSDADGLLHPTLQEGQGVLPERLEAEGSASMGRPEGGDRGSPSPAGPSAQASGSVQDGGAVPLPERLTLSEAEALAEQGRELPVEPAVLQHLVELMECGQRWEMQASVVGAAAMPVPNVSADCSCSELLVCGQAMRCLVDNMSQTVAFTLPGYQRSQRCIRYCRATCLPETHLSLQ